MRLISYRRNKQESVGVMVDDARFIDVPGADSALPPNLRRILEMRHGLDRVRAVARGKHPQIAIEEIEFLPVILEPHAIWALALNFKKHIEETGLTTSREHPQIFMRMPASVVGHRQPLLCPPTQLSDTYDYEGELAVVIGRGGRHIPVERAIDHVAGYACFNEGSVREFQSHNRQFGLGKNFEQSGSFGPWLMTADEFGDPAKHAVKTRLNGHVRQDSPLSDMLFNVPQIVHYLSTGYAVRAGDVICCGTPGALPRRPGDPDYGKELKKVAGIPASGVQMKPGDTVEVEITGLGVLRNPVVADQKVEYRPA